MFIIGKPMGMAMGLFVDSMALSGGLMRLVPLVGDPVADMISDLMHALVYPVSAGVVTLLGGTPPTCPYA